MTLERGISLGLGGLCAVLAAWLWAVNWQLDRTKARAEQWESSAQASQTALAELQRTYQVAAKALQERDHQMTALNKILSAHRRILKELENEKTVADWGRTPVPDAVSGLLKGSADAGSDPTATP